jgi:hypothetical protein
VVHARETRRFCFFVAMIASSKYFAIIPGMDALRDDEQSADGLGRDWPIMSAM